MMSQLPRVHPNVELWLLSVIGTIGMLELCAARAQSSEAWIRETRLTTLEGKRASESSVLAAGGFLFFTCACDQCRAVAKRLQPISERGILISALPVTDLRARAREYRWRGTVIVDSGSRFSLKYAATDCPRVAECTGSGLAFRTVEDLLAVRSVGK